MLNELSNKAHAAAVEKGFYERKRDLPELAMLIITELSEAVEAERKGAKIEAYRQKWACEYNVEDWDGLEVEWGERNFINPPYSQKLKHEFVVKAIHESWKGKLCVLLLPVSTSTVLFHDFILPNKPEIRFVRGRIKFEGINSFGEKVSTKCGMHDSMLVILEE